MNKSFRLKIFTILLIIFASIILFADEAPDWAFTLFDKPVATASSVLVEPGKDKNKYLPAKALDGKKETAWCEGKEDDGVGEFIEIKTKPALSKGIRIANGVFSSPSYHKFNNRIKDYEIQITLSSGKSETINGSLPDSGCADYCEKDEGSGVYEDCVKRSKLGCTFTTETYLGAASAGDRIFFHKNYSDSCITQVKFTIRSVYPGTKFKDTCISDIQMVSPSSLSEGEAERIKKAMKACK